MAIWFLQVLLYISHPFYEFNFLLGISMKSMARRHDLSSPTLLVLMLLVLVSFSSSPGVSAQESGTLRSIEQQRLTNANMCYNYRDISIVRVNFSSLQRTRGGSVTRKVARMAQKTGETYGKSTGELARPGGGSPLSISRFGR